VRYEAEGGKLIVSLSSGAELAFNPHLVRGLEAASPADFAVNEIGPIGLDIHFPRFDGDISVIGLLVQFAGAEWPSDD
jgi:hypothetical protein